MIVQLSLRELLYLDDVITVLADPDSESNQEANILLEDLRETLRPIMATAKIAATPDFVNKLINQIYIGLSIENKAEQETALFELDLDIFDILILREVAQSDVVIAEEFVGLSLKKKLYKAWLDFKVFGEDSDVILDDFEENTDQANDLTRNDVDLDEFRRHYRRH